MPKNILYESAVHQTLVAVRSVAKEEIERSPAAGLRWERFVSSLRFSSDGRRAIIVCWDFPRTDKFQFSYDGAVFYYRGDTENALRKQREAGMPFSRDLVGQANSDFFRDRVVEIVQQAGLPLTKVRARNTASGMPTAVSRTHDEERFHDQWAAGADALAIDVLRMNEACTAPEMRFITKTLGSIKGKTLLDVGSGLGEASVYFALQGAVVTATDISQGMLDRTVELAKRNKVMVVVHKSATEDLHLEEDHMFDIIYLGNLLHHVNIDATIKMLATHLKPDGVLISWDPVAYNPIINIYRRIASHVRTRDEHPLTLGDLRIFNKYFSEVRTKWFWLTTLLIFMIMAVFQRRDPNTQRYWKVVVEEGDRWKWLYLPLEILDKVLLTILPFLRPLCWNVVVVAKRPLKCSAASRGEGVLDAAV